jgi:hypothetical protein
VNYLESLISTYRWGCEQGSSFRYKLCMARLIIGTNNSSSYIDRFPSTGFTCYIGGCTLPNFFIFLLFIFLFS